MINHIFQLIACAMLLCTVSLKADGQSIASPADECYDGGYSAEVMTIILQHEQEPAMDVSSSIQATHGQPLPGVLLTVLMAGAMLRVFKRTHRKLHQLHELFCLAVSKGINKVVSIYQYYTSFESAFACCWKWQRTVLRL